MKKKRHKITPAVHLILIKDGRVLLFRRSGVEFENGKYDVISGHVEIDESFMKTTVREAAEEASIDVEASDLKVVHVMNRRLVYEGGSGERVDVFLTADKWKKDPKIGESDKCNDMQWFPLDNIPENTVSFIKAGIENVQNKIFYSEIGF